MDNEKGYVPGNLCWAMPLEQARNRRNNHWIEYEGIEATITDWCAFTGANVSTAINRLKRGVSFADAIQLKELS